MNAPIEVREVSSQQTLPLRTKILRPGYEPDEALFGSAMPGNARHFAAFDKAQIVGVGYVVAAPAPFDAAASAWQLRGMAVELDRQGQGIGALLVRHVELEARRADIAVLWFNARKIAVGFYAKLGFELQSDEFDIPTVGPHFVMSKGLKP